MSINKIDGVKLTSTNVWDICVNKKNVQMKGFLQNIICLTELSKRTNAGKNNGKMTN